MERFAACEVEAAKAIEIQAVVDISSIGGAAAFGNESLVSKSPEVIGDKVVRLADQGDELLHPAVTAGQSFKELPAQLVRQKLQE